MERKNIALLVLAQINFFVMAAICYFLLPHAPIEIEGVSYYGNYAHTLVPYVLALSGTAALIILWVVKLSTNQTPELKIFRSLLVILSVLLIFLTFTPSHAVRFLYDTHVALGGGIFLCQIGIGLWLAGWLSRRPVNILLAALQLLAAVLAMLSLPNVIDVMFLSQVLLQLTSGILVIRTAIFLHGRLPKVGEVQRKVEVLSSE